MEAIEIQKMIFIYNAVKQGWTVKMLNNGKFEFKKAKNDVKKEVLLEDYLRKFIMYNLDVANLNVDNVDIEAGGGGGNNGGVSGGVKY